MQGCQLRDVLALPSRTVQLRILVTPVVQRHVTLLVMRRFLSARASDWLHEKASGWFPLALPGWCLSTGLSD
jgi:hypothetical protein